MGAKVDWGPMGPGKPFRKESHSEWKAISNGWHGLVWAGPSDPFNNTLRAFLALNVDFDHLGGQGQNFFLANEFWKTTFGGGHLTPGAK